MTQVEPTFLGYRDQMKPVTTLKGVFLFVCLFLFHICSNPHCYNQCVATVILFDCTSSCFNRFLPAAEGGSEELLASSAAVRRQAEIEELHWGKPTKPEPSWKEMSAGCFVFQWRNCAYTRGHVGCCSFLWFLWKTKQINSYMHTSSMHAATTPARFCVWWSAVSCK